MNHDTDECRQVCRQAREKLGHRSDAARRRTDHDHISRDHLRIDRDAHVGIIRDCSLEGSGPAAGVPLKKGQIVAIQVSYRRGCNIPEVCCLGGRSVEYPLRR